VIVRAIVSFAFIWVMMPHEPDLGLGRPVEFVRHISTVSSLCANSASWVCRGPQLRLLRGAVETAQVANLRLESGLSRVRADFDAHLKQPGVVDIFSR
jgi:hypothetical protein